MSRRERREDGRWGRARACCEKLEPRQLLSTTLFTPTDVRYDGDGQVLVGSLDHLIDDSGLSTPVTTESTHGGQADYYATTWVNSDTTARLRFDLGSTQTIDGISLWNFVLEQWNDLKQRGVADFTLSFSTDGDAYSPEQAFTVTNATPNGQREAVTEVPFEEVSARYVRMNLLSSLGDAWVGLSEVKFNQSGPPPANRAPVAADDSASVTEGLGPIFINALANDTDPDGDDLNLTNVTPPADGTATINGGQLQYTPAPGFVGTDTFGYTISDGEFSDSADVTVTVNAAPQAGTLIAPTAVRLEAGTRTLAGSPTQLIDGSGLSTPESVDSVHGATGAYYATTWVGSTDSGQMRFDLGTTQRISELVLWNFALENWYDLKEWAVADFRLAFSADGSTYSAPQSFTAGSATPRGELETAQRFSFDPVDARYVRMWLDSTVSPAPFIGLGEVRFQAGNSAGTLALEASQYEIDEDAGTVSVDVVRSGGSDGRVSIDYVTVPDTATEGSDYTGVSGALVFEDGQTRRTITVPIRDDATAEATEFFSLSLDRTSGGATISAPRTARIAILDNEREVVDPIGLVANYPFDIDGRDVAGFADGNLENGAAVVSDAERGNVVAFDGGNDRVLIADRAELRLGADDADLAVSFWIKPEAGPTGDWRSVIQKGNANAERTFAMFLRPNDMRLHYRISTTSSVNEGGDTNAELAVDQWTHVAYVKDDNRLKLYLNGQLDSVVVLDGQSVANDGDIYVGDTPWFDGTEARFDDLQLYDLVLSDEEVALLAGITTPAPDLTLLGNAIFTGLVQPTAIEFASVGDRELVFIAQKNGVVRLAENGSLRSQSFIDISDQVNGTRDRGLLGLTVHPDFENNPYVYLLFTYDPPEVYDEGRNEFAGPDGRGSRTARLIRVTADVQQDYRVAEGDSERVLLGAAGTWETIGAPDKRQSVANDYTGYDEDGGYLRDVLPLDSESHTIGAVLFGQDGALYVTNGDGASYGTVDPRAARVQDLDSLAGKVIRIDPETGQGLPDNPFFDGDPDSNRSKVYSYGLRNPFRMSLHPVTGEPFIGDVGWTKWEEINTGRGANFGWPWYEGGDGTNLETRRYQDLAEAQAFYAALPDVAPPLYSTLHEGGSAIVAGDFYTGNDLPEAYNGSLFVTDYRVGTIQALLLRPDGTVDQTKTISDRIGVIVEMSMGPDGKMWYVDITGSVGTFEVQ
ncbi:MAG: PQQ-dependent sugar dehydrogenase [Planctomycetota bacterium]